jgi:hypothetical protein
MTLIKIPSKKYPNTYRAERPQPPFPKKGFIDQVKGKLRLV